MNPNIIEESHNAHMRKCRREQARIDRLPKPRVTKKDIAREIKSRWRISGYRIGKTADGRRGVVEVECNHGDAVKIGQFFLRQYPKQSYTYYVCHIFRRAHLTLYFRR